MEGYRHPYDWSGRISAMTLIELLRRDMGNPRALADVITVIVEKLEDVAEQRRA